MFLSQVMSLPSIGAEVDEFENEKEKKLKRAGVKNKWAYQTSAAAWAMTHRTPKFPTRVYAA